MIMYWIKVVALVLVCVASARCQIPAQANQYRAQLTREAHAAGGLQAPVSMFAAQVHQESRWRPAANSGVALGLAQFTPGTAAWIAKIYPSQLGGAAPLDAGWALRALVLYDYRLYGEVPSFRDTPPPSDRWAAALAAYNGGLAWVYRDAKASTCDRSLWWTCVALTPDGRTAANYKQNRDYPRLILIQFEPMYAAAGWQ